MTMRAVVLDAPGPVSNLQIRELPVPEPVEGWVRIKVKAFGLNRSELHTRLGLAEGVTFPRVPGIEATGTVDADPSGAFAPGQQVMTMMGGMGRTFDGGYAEYTCVPETTVLPFDSDLDWAVLGTVPEMLQTALGSLTTASASDEATPFWCAVVRHRSGSRRRRWRRSSARPCWRPRAIAPRPTCCADTVSITC